MSMPSEERCAPNWKHYLTKLAPFLVAIVSVCLCIGGVIGGTAMLSNRLEERVTHIKEGLVKHEASVDAKLERISSRLDNHETRVAKLESHEANNREDAAKTTPRLENHEARIARLEAQFEIALTNLREIREDVKLLLQSNSNRADVSERLSRKPRPDTVEPPPGRAPIAGASAS